MRKVLVTGGTGFTGSRLAGRLLSAGFSVRVLARKPEKAGRLLREGAEVLRGDITDRASVSEAVRGTGAVFHIAAAFREAGLPDEVYRKVNVDGTRCVLEAVAEHGTGRMVHCSTIGVYGGVTQVPADEDTPFNPGDIYQETKLEGELLVREFFEKRGLPAVIVRPCGIYGPGDMRFLKLFRSIARGRFVMVGDGRVPWHPVFIDNLVEGFLLAGEKENIEGEDFIIGDENYLSLNELVGKISAVLGVAGPRLRVPAAPVRHLGAACEKVCGLLGKEPPLHRRRVDFFTKARAFDVSKAKRVLGYEPSVDIDAGLSATAGWYREKGLL